MSDRVLKSILKELEMIKRAKQKLGRSKGGQRLYVYKRMCELEKALVTAADRIAGFKGISHLV